MPNALRLDVLDGGGFYIPFARKRLSLLKERMAKTGQFVGKDITYVLDVEQDTVSVSIFVQSIPGMDLIRIHGGGKKLFIFLVFAPHVNDAYGVDGLNYKILAYTLTTKDRVVTGLTAAGKDFSKAVETYNGSTSLVVQSSPDGKQHYALMPHTFSHQQFIDFLTLDATANFVWESSINEFQGRYYIGSNMAYRPNTNHKGYAKGGKWTEPTYDSKGNQLTPGLSGTYVRENCARARHTFRTIDIVEDNKPEKKTYYDFDLEVVPIGQVIIYAALNDVRYRTLYKHYIRHREVLDGPFIRGPLVGADEHAGNFGEDGFSYKYHVPIAVLDKDKTLVRTYENKIKIGTKTANVRVTDNLVRSSYQVDPVSGQHVEITKTTTIMHRDFPVTVSSQETTISESLKIGETALETFSKTITIDDGTGFTVDLYGNKSGWVYDSTKTENTGTYIPAAVIGYGLYDRSGSSVKGYYNGGFTVARYGPVYDGWNALVSGVKQPIWGVFIAYPGNKTSTTGNGGINVLMFDNRDGDDTWIVFYKTEAYDNRGEYGKPVNGVYGTYSNRTTTTYHLAYRITHNVTDSMGATKAVKEPVVKKILSTQAATDTGKYVWGGAENNTIVTQPDGNFATTGEYVSAVSCQIGQGIIAYTYNIYEDERGKFKKRLVGIINIDRAGLEPLKVFETELKDDDKRLVGDGDKIPAFKHDHLASVGIGID